MATKRTASDILAEQQSKRRMLGNDAKIIHIAESDLPIQDGPKHLDNNNSNVSFVEYHPRYGLEITAPEIENPEGTKIESQSLEELPESGQIHPPEQASISHETSALDSGEKNNAKLQMVQLEFEEPQKISSHSHPNQHSHLERDWGTQQDVEIQVGSKECSLYVHQEDNHMIIPREEERGKETEASETDYVPREPGTHQADPGPQDGMEKDVSDSTTNLEYNQVHVEGSATSDKHLPPTHQSSVVQSRTPGAIMSCHSASSELSSHVYQTAVVNNLQQTSYPGYISHDQSVGPEPTRDHSTSNPLPPSAIHTIYQTTTNASSVTSTEDFSQSTIDSSEDPDQTNDKEQRPSISESSLVSSVTCVTQQDPCKTDPAPIISLSTDPPASQPVSTAVMSYQYPADHPNIHTMAGSVNSGDIPIPSDKPQDVHVTLHVVPPAHTDHIFKPEALEQFIVKDPNDQDKLPNPEQLSDAVEHCVSSLYSLGDPNHHKPLPELQLHHSDLTGGEAMKENNYVFPSHIMPHGASFPGHHGHPSMVMQRPHWAARPQGPPCSCRHHGHRTGPYSYPQCRCCGPQPSMHHMHGYHMGQGQMYPGTGHHRSYSAGSGMCPSVEDRPWQRRSSSCCDLGCSRNSFGHCGSPYLHVDNSPKHPPLSSVLRETNPQSSGDFNPDFNGHCQGSRSWHNYSNCARSIEIPDHTCAQPGLGCHVEGGLVCQPESTPSNFWPYPNNQLLMNLPQPGLGRTKYLVSSYIDYLTAENERITDMSKAFTPPTYLHLEEEQYVLDAHREESPFPSNKFSKFVKQYFPQVDIISVPDSKADENSTSISQLSLSKKPLNEFTHTVFFGCQDILARKKLQEITEVHAPSTVTSVMETPAITHTVASA